MTATRLNPQPVVLFDNDAQALRGAVTLAETAANFSRLVICYRSNDGDYGSAEVWHPDGKTVSLLAARTAGGGTVNVYLKSKTVLISGTKIDTVSYESSGTRWATSQVRVEGSNAATQGDYIAITQVIGYR